MVEETLEKVDYPNPLCDSNPNCNAHYWVQLGTEIWRCRYCWTPLWLPSTFVTAEHLTVAMRAKNRNDFYNNILSKKPLTKKLIIELDRLRIAKKHLAKADFIALAIKIASSREFRLIEEMEVGKVDVPRLGKIRKRGGRN